MTQPPIQHVYVQYAPRPSTNGLAVAGLILSTVGLVLALVPFFGFFLFWVPAILGIIFGFIGVSTANRVGGLNKTQAIWAIVLGFAAGPAGFMVTGFLVVLGITNST